MPDSFVRFVDLTFLATLHLQDFGESFDRVRVQSVLATETLPPFFFFGPDALAAVAHVFLVFATDAFKVRVFFAVFITWFVSQGLGGFAVGPAISQKFSQCLLY